MILDLFFELDEHMEGYGLYRLLKNAVFQQL